MASVKRRGSSTYQDGTRGYGLQSGRCGQNQVELVLRRFSVRHRDSKEKCINSLSDYTPCLRTRASILASGVIMAFHEHH